MFSLDERLWILEEAVRIDAELQRISYPIPNGAIESNAVARESVLDFTTSSLLEKLESAVARCFTPTTYTFLSRILGRRSTSKLEDVSVCLASIIDL